jgi:chondroitin AC lyase
MTRFEIGLILLLSGLGGGVVVGATESPGRAPAIQQVDRQFRDFYLGGDDAFTMRDSNEPAPDPSNARNLAQTLAADGSWPDLDYASQARSGWPPEDHCTRMVAITAAANRPGAAAADRAILLAATHRAFGYWIAHDFQCPNWWYNEIGIPKTIGMTALLLGEELTEAELRYATGTSLARYPIGRTGQNRVWLAGNTLMRGVLAGDEAAIRAAAETIWGEVQISTAEGLQPDFSFHQHGAQLQFGNYGMAFAVETARWSTILRSTPWQLPPEELAAFRSYLIDGQNWISWRGAMDISSCARQLMPHSPRTKTATIAQVMAQTAGFDPSQAPAYRAFIARNRPGAANDLVGNRFFWRSDYMVHRRPVFAATLKMSSTRVIGAELVNSENLSGYHTADGALYLYREGDEYGDIFPVWDWRKLPGITCAQFAPPEYRTSAVPRDFVGGISDGSDGAAVLDYVRDGVSAHKAWFFSRDTVVCLGANILGTGPDPVATTINQCRLRGAVRVEADGKTRTLPAGNHTLSDTTAVEHDGWRYTVLDGAALRLDAGPVTGNWRRVFDNPQTPPADVTQEVFTLWLDHGRNPRAAHYAYTMTPIGTTAQPRVLENSATKQAVELSGGKVAIAFWTAGEMVLPDGRRIEVDAPCLVLTAAGATRVAEPTQKLAKLHLKIDGDNHEVPLPTDAVAGTAAMLNGGHRLVQNGYFPSD